MNYRTVPIPAAAGQGHTPNTPIPIHDNRDIMFHLGSMRPDPGATPISRDLAFSRLLLMSSRGAA